VNACNWRPGQHICLNASFDPELEPLCGDPGRIGRSCGTADQRYQVTPEGGQVSVAVSQAQGGIELVVSDTGEGIDPDFLPVLFTRFRQADASSTRQHGGLGLGLAIVRHLVELHGGTIRAESRGINLGAAFTVFLPSGRARATNAARKGEADKPLAGDALEDANIVLVDDDTESRELVGRSCRFGAKVHMADQRRGVRAAVADQAGPVDQRHQHARGRRIHVCPAVAELRL